jgi:hypothetical protein
MSIVRWARVAGVLVAGIVVGLLCFQGFNWLNKQRHPFDSPPPGYAKALLNDCDGFTVMGADTRRAISTTFIGDAHADSGNSISVNFEWRWVSGDKAKDSTIYQATSSFTHSNEKKEWTVDYVLTPAVRVGSNIVPEQFHCRNSK